MTKENKPFEPNYLPDFTRAADIQKLDLELKDSQMASGYYKRLVEMINRFNDSLDNEHEVGIRLVNFGQTFVFHLEDIGYYNPSLIHLFGITESDEPVELIQHISQISILLMKMKRKNPDEPKKPIGYLHNED